jgi:hypothetical protein
VAKRDLVLTLRAAEVTAEGCESPADLQLRMGDRLRAAPHGEAVEIIRADVTKSIVRSLCEHGTLECVRAIDRSRSRD